ncbi:zinc finger, CCHC-type containing protein [Tanacetum coccineum]
MTTSSGNNSVLQGHRIEKQKLTGPNFIDWYRQLRIVLSIDDKLNYLEQPLPPAPVAPAGQHVAPEILAAHTAWVKGSKEILCLPSKQSRSFYRLRVIFTPVNRKKGKSLPQCSENEGYIDNLRAFGCGHPVTLGLAGVLIPNRYLAQGNLTVCADYNMHSLGETKGKKHNKPHSSTGWQEQNQRNGKHKHAYALKPKIPPPPKREDPAKDSICHECGETGHWKRNCPQYLAELLKKEKNTATGAGGGSGLRASRKLKPGALSFAILKGWEFSEIDLSNSYANEHCYIYCKQQKSQARLDSAALVHCPSWYTSGKKRIEKFNTMDFSINDLSLYEKCFLVMSWKELARKPYTHQVERAKDLLWTNTHRRSWNLSHRTPPYTPTTQLVSQRRNRTHTRLWFDLDSQTTPSKVLWDFALETAARILNMVPTKKVEKTPYEVWHGQAPKLSYLKVWGCEALVKRDTLTKPDKLEPRSIKCIFIGYPKETMGYSFYYPPENKVLVARNAEFLENSLINQEASGSLEDLEIIQEEDTHPSIDTSLNHEEDDLEIDEPQSDIIPIRRSTRTRRPTDRMCLYIKAEEHELGISICVSFIWSAVDWKSGQANHFRYFLLQKLSIMLHLSASKEAFRVFRKFISGLGVVPTIEKPINMYCDNTGAITIANESGITKGARHFHAKVHYLREVIEFAARAYDAALLCLKGPSANLNFPPHHYNGLEYSTGAMSPKSIQKVAAVAAAATDRIMTTTCSQSSHSSLLIDSPYDSSSLLSSPSSSFSQSPISPLDDKILLASESLNTSMYEPWSWYIMDAPIYNDIIYDEAMFDPSCSLLIEDDIIGDIPLWSFC